LVKRFEVWECRFRRGCLRPSPGLVSYGNEETKAPPEEPLFSIYSKQEF
jgi:hypothetical protein